MRKTIGEYKAAGKSHLRVECACGRSTWFPWELLPFNDETVPEDVLGRFRCKRAECGKTAVSAEGRSQLDGGLDTNDYSRR